MTPIFITLSLLIPSKQGRISSGTDLGTGHRGTVCGFHTRPRSCLVVTLLANCYVDTLMAKVNFYFCITV